MKFYTHVSNSATMSLANVKGQKYLSARDIHVLTRFGGRLFPKDQYLQEMAEFIRTRPGYRSRGGKLGYEKGEAMRMWNWWFKRGVIVEMV